MRKLLLLFSATLAAFAANPFEGRWDLTIKSTQGEYPGWFELVEKDGKPQVRVQPRSGSVHPANDVQMKDGALVIGMGQMSWVLKRDGDRISGTVQRNGADAGQIAGMRAPKLDRKAPKSWSKPEPLFNGKDLTGWEPIGNAPNHWVARDGVLLNESKGANLKSTRKFDDFKLHIEFNCPDDGNSGIYLRGRYEVQVEYVPKEDEYHRMGAVYGFVPVTADVPRTPGKWETFDITLIGRRVTIVRNGITVINNQEIGGPTGGALDSNESEPGPFYFQGDHTGGMKYRNITISVPK